MTTSSSSPPLHHQRQQQQRAAELYLTSTYNFLSEKFTDLADFILRNCSVIFNLITIVVAYLPPYSSFKSDLGSIFRFPQNFVAFIFVFILGGRLNYPQKYLTKKKRNNKRQNRSSDQSDSEDEYDYDEDEDDFSENDDDEKSCNKETNRSLFYFFDSLNNQQQQIFNTKNVDKKSRGNPHNNNYENDISQNGTFLIPVSEYEINVIVKDQLPEDLLLLSDEHKHQQPENKNNKQHQNNNKKERREEISKMPADAVIRELSKLKHEHDESSLWISFFRRLGRKLRRFCGFFPNEDEFLRKYVSKIKMLKSRISSFHVVAQKKTITTQTNHKNQSFLTRLR